MAYTSYFSLFFLLVSSWKKEKQITEDKIPQLQNYKTKYAQYIHKKGKISNKLLLDMVTLIKITIRFISFFSLSAEGEFYGNLSVFLYHEIMRQQSVMAHLNSFSILSNY